MKVNAIRLIIAGVLMVLAILATYSRGKFSAEMQPVIAMMLYCFSLLVLALSFDREAK